MVTVQKWFSVSKFKSGIQRVTHQPGQLKKKQFKQENYKFECSCSPQDVTAGLVDWRDGAAEGRLRACEQESVTQPLVEACHGQVIHFYLLSSGS